MEALGDCPVPVWDSPAVTVHDPTTGNRDQELRSLARALDIYTAELAPNDMYVCNLCDPHQLYPAYPVSILLTQYSKIAS